MSKAPRETMWRKRSTIWASHDSPPVQRRIASPGGRKAAEPQTGHFSGKT